MANSYFTPQDPKQTSLRRRGHHLPLNLIRRMEFYRERGLPLE
jgi:hypothetical protein